ncbi:MAG: nucleotidyltransferase domain-containing protein [Candidatus Methylumidiphilus sp.]
MFTDDEIDRLVKQIVRRSDPEKVIIFGSYAKGTATINSDLDILVIKNTHLPMRIRKDDLLPILSNYLIRVDVHVYTPEEVEEYGKEKFMFLNSVLSTGKIVYER